MHAAWSLTHAAHHTTRSICSYPTQPPPLLRDDLRVSSLSSKALAPSAHEALASGTTELLPVYTSNSARHKPGDSIVRSGLTCMSSTAHAKAHRSHTHSNGFLLRTGISSSCCCGVDAKLLCCSTMYITKQAESVRRPVNFKGSAFQSYLHGTSVSVTGTDVEQPSTCQPCLPPNSCSNTLLSGTCV